MTSRFAWLVRVAIITVTVMSTTAQAQGIFLGEIRMFGFGFCPQGWAEANGQLLPIAQNAALFNLFGTTYGGDGQSTFALPDLRGRMAMGDGQGAGLANRALGEAGGTEQFTLTADQLPAHSHPLMATATRGNSALPTGGVLAKARKVKVFHTGPSEVAMDASSIGATGGGQPVSKLPPYLVVKVCVALQGVFPTH